MATTKPRRRRSLLEELEVEQNDREQTRTNSESLPPRTALQDENSHPRRRRWPLLQTTVDELIQDEELEERKDLEDRKDLDERKDHCEGSNPKERNDLSASVASLSDSGSLTGSRRPESPRAKSHYGDGGGVRRPIRRSTNRSTSSSGSPASAFLSQWSRNDAAVSAEPDDEGQEIGNHTKYVIGRQIGYGGFSTIKEVFTMENNTKVTRAVKIVKKHVQGKSEAENEALQTDFEHEASIWRHLKNPFILPLIDIHDDAFATYCITYLNVGGTLFDLVRSLRRARAISDTAGGQGGTCTEKNRGLSTSLAKRYIYQLASSIRYLHRDVRVVHRDIKLENCLVDTTTPDPSNTSPSSSTIGNILLCDFGMAHYIQRDDRHDQIKGSQNIGPSALSTNIAGSLQYASPELILATQPLYEPCVDMWAFGIVCYAMLTLRLPFTHDLMPAVQAMILKGEWDQHALTTEMEDGDGAKALEMVRGCLHMDVEKRWDVERVLGCEFLEGCKELYEIRA